MPDIVKQHYKSPISLLPSLRDVLRLSTVLSREENEYKRKFLQDYDINYEPVQTNNDIHVVDHDNHDIKVEDVEVNEKNDLEACSDDKHVDMDEETIAGLKAANIFMLNDDCAKFLDDVLKQNEERMKSAREQQNQVEHVEENGEKTSQTQSQSRLRKIKLEKLENDIKSEDNVARKQNLGFIDVHEGKQCHSFQIG